MTEDQIQEQLKKLNPCRFTCIFAFVVALTAYYSLENYYDSSIYIYSFNLITLIIYLPICLGKILGSVNRIAINPNLDGADLLVETAKACPYVVILLVTSMYLWYASYDIFLFHFK